MKILYLCLDWGIPILGFKGASVHVREFVTALSLQGHEVVIVTANRGTGNPLPPALLIELTPANDETANAMEVGRLGVSYDASDQVLGQELGKLAYDRTVLTRIVTTLRDLSFKPDLVYERYALFHNAGAEIARTYGIPRILEVNAPLIDEQRTYRGLRMEAQAAAIEASSFAAADHVIAVSDAVKSYVESTGVNPAGVTSVANGVDIVRFRPDIDPNPVLSRYDLHGRPVIGFVGSLKPWHGVDSLFDTLRHLNRRGLDPALLIVGDGPGLAAARDCAGQSEFAGRVHVAGRIMHNEIPAHIAAMTLTVAPYRMVRDFYFSPLKVLESLASGRPVIAPRQGQLIDLIEDGVTGLLYRPDDAVDLTHCLEAALTNDGLRVSMAENARRTAETRFSWHAVAGRSMEIAGRLRCAG